MKAFLVELATLDEPSVPPRDPELLVPCEQSPHRLVRQLARLVRGRFDLALAPPRGLARLLDDGRRFVEFAVERFGLLRLANVKEKHARAWLEELVSAGRPRHDVEESADSLARLGFVRRRRVAEIVRGLDRAP